MVARKKLFERELLEKELSEKQKQKQKKIKKATKKSPMTKPEMTGLCGCRGRCEWYGICQNLFKDEENTNPNQEENLNKTI